MRLYGAKSSLPERLRSNVERWVDPVKLWGRYKRNEETHRGNFQLIFPQLEPEVRDWLRSLDLGSGTGTRPRVFARLTRSKQTFCA